MRRQLISVTPNIDKFRRLNQVYCSHYTHVPICKVLIINNNCNL